MAETISLRKGAGARTFTLDGCVTRVKDGAGKVRRTSWMNGVMARAKRDQMVADLVAKGWTIEQAASKKTTTSTSKRRALLVKDVAVIGKKPLKPQAPSEKRQWPRGYVEFVKRFGSGLLEELVVLSQTQVRARTKAWLELAPDAEKLFVNVRECFPANDEATLIVIAASQNGDLIGFPTARPGELYLFPRGSNRMIALGSTFGDALGAWCYGEDIGPRRVEGRRARFQVL
ncbi:hypothetical protein BH11MYX4_BH11MYX4_57450 [soil metagenome]